MLLVIKIIGSSERTYEIEFKYNSSNVERMLKIITSRANRVYWSVTERSEGPEDVTGLNWKLVLVLKLTFVFRGKIDFLSSETSHGDLLQELVSGSPCNRFP